MKIIALLIVVMFASASYAAELDQDSCRKEENNSILADCIEAGKYDPCDDASGSYGLVRCLVSHKVVAERRIERATKKIAARSKKAGIIKRASVNEGGKEQPARDHVAAANKVWREYAWEHCLFMNELYSVDFKASETLAACQLRLMRERADVLEKIHSIMKHK
jgi:hypothetical protein